ncbi:hypothetical protein NSERUTF1_5361 [Nocardia seriolae]|nr:hypothetical protein NSERUTF1_5361 [Nocardia seriolae]
MPVFDIPRPAHRPGRGPQSARRHIPRTGHPAPDHRQRRGVRLPPHRPPRRSLARRRAPLGGRARTPSPGLRRTLPPRSPRSRT